MDSTFQVYGSLISFNKKTLANAMQYSKYSKYGVVDCQYKHGAYYIVLSNSKGPVELKKTPHQLRKLLYPLVLINSTE